MAKNEWGAVIGLENQPSLGDKVCGCTADVSEGNIDLREDMRDAPSEEAKEGLNSLLRRVKRKRAEEDERKLNRQAEYERRVAAEAEEAARGLGYHLTLIPKGVLGEPSKVMEEASELADAHQQGVGIMALVEAADLYGALRAFLARHHPDKTMADLAAMADVTERAFRNGHR